MINQFTIGDLFRPSKGKKATNVFDAPLKGARRYIQINDLRTDDKIFYTNDLKGVEVQPQDICIAWDGANAGTIGYGLSGLIGSTIARLRPLDESKVFTPFVGRFLQSKFDYLNSGTTGATIPHVSKDKLESLIIPLPLLSEQRRIAAILDKADAVRRKRQESIRLTEEFLRSVFLDMFGDPVTNPKGWAHVPLKELGVVTTGNTPPRNILENYGDHIEWIKSDNINTPHHFLTEAKEKLSFDGAKIGRIVPKNSVLVTCIAGSPECIGNAAIADRDVAFNQQINAITPFSDVDPYFLYAQFLVAKKHVQKSSTDSMKGMISKGKFEKILFIKPSFEHQMKFGKFFSRHHALLNNSNLSRKLEESLFNSLVQRAFRGEL